MFAHKEISHKVRGPTRSENTRHSGFTANDVCIFCMRFERIIHSVCADFAPRKLLIVRHYTMPCAYSSKRHACVRVKSNMPEAVNGS